MNLDIIKLNWRIARLYLADKKVETSDFQRSYELLASSYDDEWYQYLNGVTTDIFDEIKLLQPKYILDLGCGTGSSTLKLKKMFPSAHIVGLDFSKAMLKQARRKLGPEKVILVRDTLENGLTKFKEGQFDLVVCAWSLGYGRKKNVYRLLSHILNTNGHLLILTNKYDTLKAVQHSIKYTMYKHYKKIRKLPLHKFPKDREYLLKKLGKRFEEKKFGEGHFAIDITHKSSVIDWLLNTGILAGYEYILNLRKDELTRKTYEDYIKSNYNELVHNYMWILARKTGR